MYIYRMQALSIIIVVKNEAHNIARCIAPLLQISNDIIVADNGSEDGTQAIAAQAGAKVMTITWKGYSATKNEANSFAANDWILSLDADEVLNEELVKDIQRICSNQLSTETVFAIQRKLVYEGRLLKHGAVGKEFRIRLFNRNNAEWNQQVVHEKLVFAQTPKVHKLKGFAWHYSYKDEADHKQRLQQYALLAAKQMKARGKKRNLFKQSTSPLFGFFKNYICRLGFMDGRAGLKFALNEMNYTYQKYALLSKI
jgi:glycosyltransferase involved in cell wall biosynthesis